MSLEAKVFAIFRSADEAELAVRHLAALCVDLRDIAVLLPENKDTRAFAKRQGTRPPAGTVEGVKASLPLDGTFGLLDPATGPIEGALSLALADMGVPADWCDFCVVNGRILVSVSCDAHSYESISAILRDAGAIDLDHSAI
jgi:hypothetical protein